MSEYNYILHEICDVLEISDGRDKILRSLCYIAKLAGAVAHNETHAKRLREFSSQMSRARNIVQLLNDIPMIKHTVDYGFGGTEPETFIAVMGVLTNLVDHIGYTIEKVTWLSETKLIILNNPKSWETVNSVCKIASIYFTFMKSLRYIMLLHKKIYTEEKFQDKRCAHIKLELITLIRMSLDFTHAINSLPPGFLWSAKIDSLKIGVIGTISSVLSVVQIFMKRAVKSKYIDEIGLL